MRFIKVDESAYATYEKLKGDKDDSKLIRSLVKLGRQRAQRQAEEIALVILEDLWWDLNENPGHASNEPFLEGLCRMVDTLHNYRFNFYSAESFSDALKRAMTVPEHRVILYIAAHGSRKCIGNAHARTLMKKVAETSRDIRKIEGVILSSCLVGGNDGILAEGLSGRSSWIFGYTSSVDWLGSVQIETAVLKAICDADADYAEDEDKVIDVFANALRCFNPAWSIGGRSQDTLARSIRLAVRGKHKKEPSDGTALLAQEAWGIELQGCAG